MVKRLLVEFWISLNNWSRFLFVLVLLLALAHLITGLGNHYFFRTYGYDYAVYGYAFFNYAHLSNSPVPFYLQDFDIRFIQDHFSLTLIFLSPLYWILNPIIGTYSLLFIQFMLIMLGAWATYRIIYERYENSAWALVGTLMFLGIYSKFAAYQNDCNLAIFGSALTPVFLLYYFRKKYFTAFGVLLLLMFNREDFPLGTFFLAIFLLVIANDKIERRWSLIFAFISIVVFVLDFTVFIPALEDEHKQFSLFNYTMLGKGPGDAVKFIITKPGKFLSFFVKGLDGQISENKLRYYELFFLSGGLFLFLRPACFIPLIPLITKKMLNDDLLRNSAESYHGVEIANLLPVLVFLSFDKIRNYNIRSALTIAVLFVVTHTTYRFFKSSPEYKPNFNKFNPFIKSFYQTDSISAKNLQYMVDMIPLNAPVSASPRIATHMANRWGIYYFPKNTELANYVLVFLTKDTWPSTLEEHKKQISDLVKTGRWKIVCSDGEEMLLEKIY